MSPEINSEEQRFDLGKELDYYARSFKAIRNKKYEFLAISGIIHRLNDPEVEFSTQQLVRLGEHRALLDLYFPQFELCVEVDEEYHLGQLDEDKEREEAVKRIFNKRKIDLDKSLSEITVDLSDLRLFMRLAVKDATLATFNAEIDRVVTRIRKERDCQKHMRSFMPFKYGDRESSEHWISIGRLRVADDDRLGTHTDVRHLFQNKKAPSGPAIIKLGKDDNDSTRTKLWFPKLYPNRNWNNSLSSDGEIIQFPERGGDFDTAGQSENKPGDPDTRLIVFAHRKDSLGRIFYKFVGVFVNEGRRSSRTTFRRIFSEIFFDGVGHFSIERLKKGANQ